MAEKLRSEGVEVRFDPDGQLKRQLGDAAKAGVRWVVIIGGTQDDTLILRDLHARVQQTMGLDDACSTIKATAGKNIIGLAS